MADDKLRQLSKLMSLVLRHEPERFGLLLDPEGFVPIAELVAALQPGRPVVTLEDILAVVDTVERDKQRFAIVGDSVRANYGHRQCGVLAGRRPSGALPAALPLARKYPGRRASQTPRRTIAMGACSSRNQVLR